MTSRLQKLRASFETQKIDGMIVSRDVNIRYLTGFPASEGWLLVTTKKAYYVTDFRYALEAKKGLPSGIEFMEYKTSLGEAVFDLAAKNRIKRLGFESSHISFDLFQSLSRIIPKLISFLPKKGLIEQFRMIKDSGEIALMRQALKIHFEALKRLKRWVKPGVTEMDVLFQLEDFVRSQNAGFSFAPIIASGPNGALPHAHPSRRVIKNCEPVLVDTGIDWKGYKSDLTRMFFLGRMPALVKKMNDLVKEAQRLAIAAIQPGAKTSEIDRVARGFLAKHKVGQYFGHSLGHGVGLDIHEEPRLSGKSTATLQAGMVVTVEPAVYLPGKFGIRLEEMVLVTKKGCEVLSEHYH